MVYVGGEVPDLVLLDGEVGARAADHGADEVDEPLEHRHEGAPRPRIAVRLEWCEVGQCMRFN